MNKRRFQNTLLLAIFTICLIPYATSFIAQNAWKTNQTNLIEGLFAGDYLGSAVSGAGDVNADGFDDIIISEPTSGAGIAYVLFGSQNGIKNIDLKNLTSAQGFKILGAQDGAGLGSSVSRAGDVNGDGIDDIIIAQNATQEGPNGYPYAYVIFGKKQGLSDIDLKELTPEQGIQITDHTQPLSIVIVSGAGDMNGDGLKDLIIGAPTFNITYIVFGTNKSLSSIDLNNLTPSQGIRITSASIFDNLGVAVSAAGDINADGVDDVVIGANGVSPLGRSYAGVSYVIFGSRDQLSDLDINDLKPTQGFRIIGATSDDGFGSSVSGAGDFNGDGIDDLIVGAPEVSLNGMNQIGAAYIIFGKSTGFSDIDLSNFSYPEGIKIQGPDSFIGQLGNSVSGAGDVNGDGVDDVVVGALGVGNTITCYGAAYVILGSRDGLSDVDVDNLEPNQGFEIKGEVIFGMLGASVSGAGDVNGDGLDDLVIGAPGLDIFAPYQLIGRVYVVTF